MFDLPRLPTVFAGVKYQIFCILKSFSGCSQYGFLNSDGLSTIFQSNLSLYGFYGCFYFHYHPKLHLKVNKNQIQAINEKTQAVKREYFLD